MGLGSLVPEMVTSLSKDLSPWAGPIPQRKPSQPLAWRVKMGLLVHGWEISQGAHSPGPASPRGLCLTVKSVSPPGFCQGGLWGFMDWLHGLGGFKSFREHVSDRSLAKAHFLPGSARPQTFWALVMTSGRV